MTNIVICDHCHSTEKEEVWRVQRKFFKQGKIGQLPVLKHPETTRSTVSNLPKSCPTLACSQPLNNGYAPPVMLSKSSTIRACSPYSNLAAPSITSPRYHQQPAHTQMTPPLPTQLTSGRNRLPHHGVSRSTSFSPSSSIINNTIRKEKGTGGASLGPRVDSHVKFKRCGESILTNNRSGHGFDKNTHVHIPQLQRSHHSTVSLPEKNPHTTVPQPQRSHHITVSQDGSHHRTVSQPERSHHTPSSQALSSHHTSVSQPQRSHPTTESQPHQGHQATISLPQRSRHTTSQPQRSHHTTAQPQRSHHTMSQPQRSHHTTAQPQRSHHVNVIYSSISDTSLVDSFVDINSEPAEYQSASQPILSSSYTDCPSYNMAVQPQVHSQPIPQSSEQNVYLQPIPQSSEQNAYLPENPAPSATNQNIPDFEMNWVNDTVHGVGPSAVSSQHPSMQSPSGPPPVTEVNPQCPGATNSASADFDLDSWIQSLQPNLESVKDTMSSELGFMPTQDGMVDAAARLLFDFESS
ncbi:hypothetical protein AQUCO_02500066v1 [Aquilegia coerulea]|uniref:Uncharacterized protein n=1 Tax=Aquilegia coerulea TaxID=218851 RepID=A0A2G5D9B8_AQUCA|nr:hypothetical protein AQUCO_02500066v1 [Aquilegia coerulea]